MSGSSFKCCEYWGSSEFSVGPEKKGPSAPPSRPSSENRPKACGTNIGSSEVTARVDWVPVAPFDANSAKLVATKSSSGESVVASTTRAVAADAAVAGQGGGCEGQREVQQRGQQGKSGGNDECPFAEGEEDADHRGVTASTIPGEKRATRRAPQASKRASLVSAEPVCAVAQFAGCATPP